MTLDRETDALQFWVSASPTTPVWELDVAAARAAYRRSVAQSEITPPEIGATHDLTAPGPSGEIALRKYTPLRASAASVLYFHGGGGVLGDIDTHDPLCRTLCHDSGATVFSVGYRLAPEHPFPAAVDDAIAALRWLSREAPDLALDPARIAVAGDSAGGALAVVALHETKGLLEAPAAAQLLIYPALDLHARQPSRRELIDQFPLPEEMLHWFFNHTYGNAWPIADPRAVPALYQDCAGLPPTLIVTAGYDPLRDEGAAHAKKLEAADVPVEYLCYEGTVHGFMNMGRMLKTAHRTTRTRIRSWLVERLAT